MARSTCYCKPEIWGGIECSINRINNQFQDQLEYAGYYQRNGDLRLFAEMGIKAMRFPILWEKHQPRQDEEPNFLWAEQQVNEMRSFQIEPIAGLLHHGSGPAFTSLIDDNFPELFAAYAKKVATKFPSIQYYTPINEPLTTARFSGLYGHWYPHHKNDLSFAKMLLNQLKGVVLAMEEIRKINPNAKLIQTEDLGKTYASPGLLYQASFENSRRWLTFDILTGRMNAAHRMWKYFKKIGIAQADLAFFLEHPCPPDILGMNYYVTSERYLDDRTKDYPRNMVGGNGRHRYVDVEAVRVPLKESIGLPHLLKEAWTRFHLPIAITEVQLHCHHEEQMRWFMQVWTTVNDLNKQGLDIRAVTAWSLLGAFGWNKLLKKKKGDYESGVFDIRSGTPRPTALFHLIKSLNESSIAHAHLLTEPGWWQRDRRFWPSKRVPNAEISYGERASQSPLLIIGKTGTLGNAFARLCETRAIHYRLLGRNELNICDAAEIEQAINKYKPWAIVNAAGYVRVDDAEMNTQLCFSVNTQGAMNLSKACAVHGIRFVNFSTDLVFDGLKMKPYVESDSPSPLNTYGRSKAQAERMIMNVNPDALIIRTSAFFGPWDKYNFASHVLNTLTRGEEYFAADDVRISPTYVPDLVHHALDLLIDGEKAIWHISNNGSVTWFEFAKEIAERGKVNHQLITHRPMHEMSLTAKRPAYSVLKSEKGIILPSVNHALDRFFLERQPQRDANTHSSAA
jgi:dTDP-4-dehydrorhamnose reductase